MGATTGLVAEEESRTVSMIAVLMTVTTLEKIVSPSSISEERRDNRRVKILSVGIVQCRAKCATCWMRSKCKRILNDSCIVCHGEGTCLGKVWTWTDDTC